MEYFLVGFTFQISNVSVQRDRFIHCWDFSLKLSSGSRINPWYFRCDSTSENPWRAACSTEGVRSAIQRGADDLSGEYRRPSSIWSAGRRMCLPDDRCQGWYYLLCRLTSVYCVFGEEGKRKIRMDGREALFVEEVRVQMVLWSVLDK